MAAETVLESIRRIGREYRFRPLDFICRFIDWNEVPGDVQGPQKWQRELLADLQTDLYEVQEDGRTEAVLRYAVSSGHGVGKSAVLGLINAWAVVCLPGLRGVMTANTEAQITNKLWPEYRRWLSFLHPGLRETLKITNSGVTQSAWGDAGTVKPGVWSATNLEAFQGTHGTYVIMSCDESTGLPMAVWDVIDGALTTGICIHIATSNPTRLYGKFHQIMTADAYKDSWNRRYVSGFDSELTNKDNFRTMIKQYGGAESEKAMVRIFGRFPSAVEDQLFDAEVLDTFFQNQEPDEQMEKGGRFGFDVAGGGRSESVLVYRTATKMYKPHFFNTVGRENEVADAIVDLCRQRDAVFIAVDSNGFGQGMYQKLKERWDRVIEVMGQGNPQSRHIYANRRAELFFRLKAWLAPGEVRMSLGAGEVAAQLRAIRVKPGGDGRGRPILMAKRELYKGGGKSDIADALSLTFFHREDYGAVSREMPARLRRRPVTANDWMGW